MKKIVIHVKKGEEIVKKFYLEEKALNTANGTVRGLSFRCETKGMNGFSEGYVIGSVLMDINGNQIGAFTRPPVEIVKGDTFQLQFTTTAPFDCVCISCEDIAPAPAASQSVMKHTPRGVKTREEIEWELRQMKNIPTP